MLNTLISFLAPAAASTAAAESSPPAVAPSVLRRPRARAKSLRFGLRVVGDALGFAILFAGCWLTLQLLAAFL